MTNCAQIFEIFSSIQGEGKYVGEKQIFVRFSGCNLKCNYCDTEHLNGKKYTVEQLVDEINKYDLRTIHSVSLTGGEPLLYADFINELAQKTDVKMYLETNATLTNELKKVVQNIDFVAADLKLASCTAQDNDFEQHTKFLQVAKKNNVDTFLKVVFDENITDFEMQKCVNIAKEFDYEIFLQPKMTETDFAVDLDFALSIFEKFKQKYSKVRFCPQMHKFWHVR